MALPNPASPSTNSLVAGRDYPNTYREFVTMFPDEASCAKYLERLRWPETFVCPTCRASTGLWRQTRGRLVCPACRHQATATAGTLFDKTRTPLTTWFEAAWHVTTAKSGLSAVTLQRTLGTSYRVAWAILQRFRVAMVRTGRPSLSGEVEVDETFVGGVEHGGSRGRGTDRSIVVIAVEVKKPKGLGRIRMRHVADASGDNLIPFVTDVAEPGSTILTDGWGGYNDLPKHGFKREKIILSSSGDPAHVSMPGVHIVASLLKRWLLGTHQGAVDATHLQAYLEEFTFRFNRRHSRSRGLVFRRLLEQATVAGPVTESDVVGGYSWEDRTNEPRRS
jgi:transposase-like protein